MFKAEMVVIMFEMALVFPKIMTISRITRRSKEQIDISSIHLGQLSLPRKKALYIILFISFLLFLPIHWMFTAFYCVCSSRLIVHVLNIIGQPRVYRNKYKSAENPRFLGLRVQYIT